MPRPRRSATGGMGGASPIRARSSFRSPSSAATSATTALSRDPPRRGEARLSRARRGAGDRARRRARRAARRRCSRSATSPSCAIARRATALARLGYETTLDYLAAMAALVLRETGLLPHLNPGVMTREDIARLRPVSVSQGLMLETRGRAPVRPRRPAFRLARQACRRVAARDHRGGRRSVGAVHLRPPDRHRRDARPSASRRCWRCAICTSATATSRKSSSRISAPSRARGWPTRPSPTSTICSGPSPWRGSCSARR